MKSVSYLIAELDKEDYLKRAQAALELGEMGAAATAAIPALISLLEREVGREATREVDRENPSEKMSIRLAAGAAMQALTQIGRHDLEPIIGALHHRKALVRKAGALVLGEIGPAAGSAAPALAVAARTDSDEPVRMAAATALQKLEKKWWQFWK